MPDAGELDFPFWFRRTASREGHLSCGQRNGILSSSTLIRDLICSFRHLSRSDVSIMALDVIRLTCRKTALYACLPLSNSIILVGYVFCIIQQCLTLRVLLLKSVLISCCRKDEAGDDSVRRDPPPRQRLVTWGCFSSKAMQ